MVKHSLVMAIKKYKVIIHQPTNRILKLLVKTTVYGFH